MTAQRKGRKFNNLGQTVTRLIDGLHYRHRVVRHLHDIC